MEIKVGLGFDIHKLVEGRKLFLGGVEIEHGKGLLGHSDADVLLHALCDAMLGALALGDIGVHFPNNDDRFKNIDSKILLQKTNQLINEQGYEINNADVMLLCEQPKISPHVLNMRTTISSILNCGIEQISIKATTMETLGFIGRDEGIAAQAIVSLTTRI